MKADIFERLGPDPAGQDIRAITRLRRYYLAHFVRGDDDESFLKWVQHGCSELVKARSKAKAQYIRQEAWARRHLPNYDQK